MMWCGVKLQCHNSIINPFEERMNNNNDSFAWFVCHYVWASECVYACVCVHRFIICTWTIVLSVSAFTLYGCVGLFVFFFLFPRNLLLVSEMQNESIDDRNVHSYYAQLYIVSSFIVSKFIFTFTFTSSWFCFLACNFLIVFVKYLLLILEWVTCTQKRKYSIIFFSPSLQCFIFFFCVSFYYYFTL